MENYFYCWKNERTFNYCLFIYLWSRQHEPDVRYSHCVRWQSKTKCYFSFSQSLSLSVSVSVCVKCHWLTLIQQRRWIAHQLFCSNESHDILVFLSFFVSLFASYSSDVLCNFRSKCTLNTGCSTITLNLWHGGILYFSSNTIFRVYSCIIRPKFSHSSLLIWCDNARND